MSRQKTMPTGKQIKKALIDLGMNQVDVARAVGVSDMYIRMITAERRKAVATRRRISQFIATEHINRGMRPPKWTVENNQQKGA